MVEYFSTTHQSKSCHPALLNQTSLTTCLLPPLLPLALPLQPSFLMVVECDCYSVLLHRATRYYRSVLSVASGASCTDRALWGSGESTCSSPRVTGRGPMHSASQEPCAAEEEGTGQRAQDPFSCPLSSLPPESPSSSLSRLLYSSVLLIPLSSQLLFHPDTSSHLLCPPLPSSSLNCPLPPSSPVLPLLPPSFPVLLLPPPSSTSLPPFIPHVSLSVLFTSMTPHSWLLTLTSVLDSASPFPYWCHSFYMLYSGD